MQYLLVFSLGRGKKLPLLPLGVRFAGVLEVMHNNAQYLNIPGLLLIWWWRIDDELFWGNVWPTKVHWAFFSVWIIATAFHHWKSPTSQEQNFNLRKTWIKTLLNEVVHKSCLLHHSAKISLLLLLKHQYFTLLKYQNVTSKHW